MIYIERHPVPAFLSAEGNRWTNETNEAIQYYSQGAQEKEFAFEHYRHPEMKEALMKNFPKCVYCESSYAGVSDGDIEHFRPKGRVFGKIPPNPGYYWLANSWDNLFMSCMHCNQVRKHKMENDEKVRGLGKLDQFPLKGDNQYRIVHHSTDIIHEEPYRLLLNPCIENPEEHLKYDENALIASDDEKGKESIKVFVLQRPFLVQERKLRLALLFMQIGLTMDALLSYDKKKSVKRRVTLERHMDGLKGFTESSQAYAGMCRFFVKRFLYENHLL